jgi:hypothetical protein
MQSQSQTQPCQSHLKLQLHFELLQSVHQIVMKTTKQQLHFELLQSVHQIMSTVMMTMTQQQRLCLHLRHLMAIDPESIAHRVLFAFARSRCRRTRANMATIQFDRMEYLLRPSSAATRLLRSTLLQL